MSNYGKQNILLLMSGSIACARASSLISEWRRRGHPVRVACTSSTRQFIGRATLEGLGAEAVFEDLFAPGQAMDHIRLARWADLVIACPATSNLLGKLAAGIADDTVTTLWQAAYGSGRPMLLVPAMNTRMWAYPATVENVGKLRSWGVLVMPPGEGDLACGETGAGRMPKPEEILDAVDAQLQDAREGPVRRVLITAGGTREPIDSVRYIGNISTGRTAADLAERLVRAGHELTWLGAEEARVPRVNCPKLRFSSFGDLDRQLCELLGDTRFDLVIHSAAVSDFSVSSVESASWKETNVGKLPSDAGLKLCLKPNPKLLDRLRGYSCNPSIKIIGFKLTDTADRVERARAVKRLLEGGIDAVVHNDVGEISGGRHPYSLHPAGEVPLVCGDSGELAGQIDEMMRRAS